MSRYTKQDKEAKAKELRRQQAIRENDEFLRVKREECAADGGHVYNAHGLCVGCGHENLLFKRTHP